MELSSENKDLLFDYDNKINSKCSLDSLPFIQNWPSDVSVSSKGWCLVTFATTWEARKAAFGMKFLSHFNKLSIDTHNGKQFFYYFDRLSYLIYSAIE